MVWILVMFAEWQETLPSNAMITSSSIHLHILCRSMCQLHHNNIIMLWFFFFFINILTLNVNMSCQFSNCVNYLCILWCYVLLWDWLTQCACGLTFEPSARRCTYEYTENANHVGLDWSASRPLSFDQSAILFEAVHENNLVVDSYSASRLSSTSQ